MKKTAASFALVAAAALCAPIAAAADAKDMQVIGRALSFVDGGAKGEVTVAIVYAPDAAGSKAEADEVAALLGSGLAAGDVTMKPKVIAISDLASAGSAAALYVPKGMSAHYGALSALKKLIVTTDDDCVKAGACVLSVKSAPKVEIIVSRSAAAAKSITFGAAFRMLIKEI